MSRQALWIAARAYDLGNADPVAVEELISFAFDCWPQSDRFPIYHTLQLRRRMSPHALSYVSPLLVSPFVRKAHGWLQRQSWKHRGY